ncbi:MAG: leucine-rich repeat protein [Clostridia bacterium]
MKKVIKSTVIFVILLMLSMALVACGENNASDNNTTDVKTISSIAIDASGLPSTVVIGNLDLSSVKVKIYYVDGTTEDKSITEDMVSIEDRPNLVKAGTQTINVIYEGFSSKFTIKLVESPVINYTLVVEGGYPVEVDGVQVSKPILVDGIFSATYLQKTKVTISWERVEGQEFVEWMDNGNKSVNSSITEVTLNGDHSLVAITKAMVNTVYFHTNGADKSTLAPKRIDILNQIDINSGNVLTREDFVFDGWTTAVVSDSDKSALNCTEDKITFPYDVKVETNLYATWRNLGLDYASDGSDGYVISGYTLGLTDVNKAPTILEIPKLHFNCIVTGIRSSAFDSLEASALRQIIISENISNIEDGAFKNCKQLKSITVDDNSEFYQEDINGAIYTSNGEKLIAYPAGKLMSKYNVYNTTKEIAKYAFKDALLGSIELCENIEVIGENAFDSVHFDNIDMQNVKYNAETNFAANIFNDNTRKILVANTYYSDFKALFSENIDDKLTMDEVDLTNITIKLNPSNNMLYRIINYEDAYPTSYDGIEIIGVDRSLTAFTVVPDLEGRKIFSIGREAFNGCIFMNSVNIPYNSNVDRIEKKAFEDTPWLNNLDCVINNDALIVNNVLYQYLGNSSSYSIPESIKEIAEGAFEDTLTLNTVNLSSSSLLNYIGAYAFSNCSNLTGTINLLSSVEVIHKFAFANTAIKHFTLEDESKLSTLSEGVFNNCMYLIDIELSGNISSITNKTFDGCMSLESFTQQLNTVAKKYSVVNNILYKCNNMGTEDTLFKYPAGKMMSVFDISLGSLSITTLVDNCLEHSNIGALIIPSSVTSISSTAISVEGLVYIEFKSINTIERLTYNKIFANANIEPNYIVFDVDVDGDNLTQTEETSINNFYNNVALRALKTYYNNNHSKIEIVNDSFIYEFDTDSLNMSIVKTSRTCDEIIIPTQANVAGEGDIDIKYIKKFAFAGNYLNKVIINANLDTIYFNAFSNANNLAILDLQSLITPPDLENNTLDATDVLNAKFNKGLVIYICTGATINYETNWSANKKYLLELGIASAKFKSSTVEENWKLLDYYQDDDTIATTAEKEYTLDNTIFANKQPMPRRDGYIFLGWKDENGQKILDNENDYNILWHTIFYAQWEAIQYNIIYDVEIGTTIDNTSISVYYNEDFNYEIPTYPNKTFICWKDTNGTTYGRDTDESIWLAYPSASDIVLSPVWADKKYTINYDEDSLDGVSIDNTDSVIVIYGNSYHLEVPTKIGYKFIGWSLAPIVENETPILITNIIGDSLKFWTLNGDILEYTAYPYFVVHSEQEVNLYINQDTAYKTIGNIIFGDPFTFEYKASDISDGNILLQYPIEKFCGWADIDGNRITDELGFGVSWEIDTIAPTDLYAIWPTEINNQADFNAWLLTPTWATSSIILYTDVTVSKTIGDTDNAFNGVFLGNNKLITFNYSKSLQTDILVGLFAKNDGTLRDIKANINIAFDSTDINVENLTIGGLVAINNGNIYNTLENTDDDIIINIVAKVLHNNNVVIGGLVGLNTGIINNVSCVIDTIALYVDGNRVVNNANVCVGIVVGTINSGEIKTRSVKYFYDLIYKLTVNCGQNNGGTMEIVVVGTEK